MACGPAEGHIRIKHGQRIPRRIIDHLQGPIAGADLTQKGGGAKAPGAIEITAVAGISDQLHPGALRRGQKQLQIGQVIGSELQFHRHMADDHVTGTSLNKADTRGISIRHNCRKDATIKINAGHSFIGRGGLQGPGFRQPHRSQSVHQTKAIVI